MSSKTETSTTDSRRQKGGSSVILAPLQAGEAQLPDQVFPDGCRAAEGVASSHSAPGAKQVWLLPTLRQELNSFPLQNCRLHREIYSSLSLTLFALALKVKTKTVMVSQQPTSYWFLFHKEKSKYRTERISTKQQLANLISFPKESVERHAFKFSKATKTQWQCASSSGRTKEAIPVILLSLFSSSLLSRQSC